MQTLYSILEVSEDASPEAIRTAYRRLMQKYHPDMCPDSAFAARKARQINRAYSVLANPDLRRRYDEKLSQVRTRTPPKNDPPNPASPTPDSSPEKAAQFEPSKQRGRRPRRAQQARRSSRLFYSWIFLGLLVIGGMLMLRNVPFRSGEPTEIVARSPSPDTALEDGAPQQATTHSDQGSETLDAQSAHQNNLLSPLTTATMHPIEPFRDGERTAVLAIPQDAKLVEVGFVSELSDSAATKYPGYVGSLIINGRLVVAYHWRYTAGGKSYGIALDFKGQKINTRVPESTSGMLDITELIQPGASCPMAFSHKHGGKIGIRVKITRDGSK